MSDFFHQPQIWVITLHAAPPQASHIVTPYLYIGLPFFSGETTQRDKLHSLFSIPAPPLDSSTRGWHALHMYVCYVLHKMLLFHRTLPQVVNGVVQKKKKRSPSVYLD